MPAPPYAASFADVPGMQSVDRVARGATVVPLAGDLTRRTAPALRTRLIDTLGALGAQPRLVLDLRGVTMCDKDGLAVLEATADRARRRGGQLWFVHADLEAALSGHARPTATP